MRSYGEIEVLLHESSRLRSIYEPFFTKVARIFVLERLSPLAGNVVRKGQKTISHIARRLGDKSSKRRSRASSAGKDTVVPQYRMFSNDRTVSDTCTVRSSHPHRILTPNSIYSNAATNLPPEQRISDQDFFHFFITSIPSSLHPTQPFGGHVEISPAGKIPSDSRPVACGDAWPASGPPR